jgi:LuxR family maltose regulon positive regulatory protein
MIQRPRLLRALDTPAALTVVRAPGGGGKTTLLAQWASSTRPEPARPGIWLTVDSATATRGAFWRALLERAADAIPEPDADRVRDAMRELDRTGDDRWLLAVLRPAFRVMSTNLTVVLDDYDQVADAQVSDDLVTLLESSPTVRILVAQRGSSALESPAVGVRLDTVLLTPQDLRFTEHETAAVLELAGIETTGDSPARVRDATLGLPLSTRAVVLALQRGAEIRNLRESVAPYLTEVLTSRASNERMYGFLLRVSLVDSITVALAVRLSGAADAQALLDQAETEGLGLWSGDRFVFGSLVRAALRADLAARHPEELPMLKRIAAEWLATTGSPFLGFALAVEADDLDTAAAIARLSWFDIATYNAPGVIASIGSVPLGRIRRYPFLALVLALAYNTSGMHRVRAVEMFGMAVASAHLIGNRAAPIDRIFLLTLQSVALRVVGQADRAQGSAEAALHSMAELSVDDYDAIVGQAPAILIHNGLTLFYCGRLDEALEAFERSWALTADAANRTGYRSLALAAAVHALRGDIPEAAELVTRLRDQRWPAAWREDRTGSMYRVVEAALALERLDFAAAQAQVSAVSQTLDTIEHWPLFVSIQAMIDLGEGRAEAASTTIGPAIARYDHKRALLPYARTQLALAQSAVYQASGHPGQADAVLSKLPRATAPWTVTARARTALVSGRPELALQLLTDDTATFQSSPSRTRVEAYLLAAAAARRIDRPNTALACLERAAGLMADRGLRLPLMLIPRSDLDGLVELAESRGRTGLPELAAGLVIPSVLPDSVRIVTLTDRENVVLNQLAHTGNTAEIAAALFVSVNTVKSQLRSLYRKLGAGSREEALLVAREGRLLGDDGFHHDGTGAGGSESRRPA